MANPFSLRNILAMAIALSPFTSFDSHADIVVETFDGFSLPPEQYQTVTNFSNFSVEVVSTPWDTAVSRKREMTDVNVYWASGDYSVVSGGGANASEQWFAAFNLNPGDVVFTAHSGSRFESVEINNVAVVDYAVRNGLYSASAFQSGDYLRVRFLGVDSNNAPTGLSTPWIDLARYTSSLYVQSNWLVVNLAQLQTNRMVLEFEGSDNDPTYGLNTPTYLAFDNVALSVVPEPSSLAMLGVGMLVYRRSRCPQRRSALDS